MKLKNVLIVVENLECSKKFYHDLFGLEAAAVSEGNMILTEGLVLQEKKRVGQPDWKNVCVRRRSRRIVF